MIPTISQVCSLHSPFAQDLADYAAGQCRSLEIWMTKLEDFLEREPIEAFLRLRDQHGLTTPVASYQGGVLAAQGERRAAAWQLFERRMQLCQQLGISTLVMACDIPPPVAAQDVERVQFSLRQVAALAEQVAVRIALEFQAGAAFGNNLQTAAMLVDEVGSPLLGLCLDAFHFYVGPSKLPDLGLLSADNLFHVQLSDLADCPREFAADSHRILPGEGDIPIANIVARLREIHYQQCVSVEVLNPRMWQVPPLQFAEIAMQSLRRLLGP